MVLKEYVSLTKQKLEDAQNYGQVDSIINESVVRISNEGSIKEYFSALEKNLEQLSPLDCNSTQWSCFRYAILCLHYRSGDPHFQFQ